MQLNLPELQTQPLRTYSNLPCRPAFISSQWFQEVQCSRTTPNSFELSLCDSGSRRFGGVQPPGTHSNLPCWLYQCGSRRFSEVEHHSGSRKFGAVEPQQAHTLPCIPASPLFTVVRGGSVRSNRPKVTQTFPVGLLPPTSQWFTKVRAPFII